MSVTIPATVFKGNALYKTVLSVEIPDIWWLPIKETPVFDLISVDNPDISRVSPTLNWWVFGTNTEIVFGSFLVNIRLSNLW